jgi:hypothetical protein
MDPARNEHHVKPIAWVWAAGIVAASIGGAVFVTQWKPMTRTRSGVPIPSAAPAAKRYVLPLDRPNLPIPLTRDPSEPGAALYNGVSRLIGGDEVGAIDPLNAAVRLSTGDAERTARWYLAVALERAGRPDDAAAALDSLCEVPGTGLPGSVPGTGSSGPVPGTPSARPQDACTAAATLRRVRP